MWNGAMSGWDPCESSNALPDTTLGCLVSVALAGTANMATKCAANLIFLMVAQTDQTKAADLDENN